MTELQHCCGGLKLLLHNAEVREQLQMQLPWMSLSKTFTSILTGTHTTVMGAQEKPRSQTSATIAGVRVLSQQGSQTKRFQAVINAVNQFKLTVPWLLLILLTPFTIPVPYCSGGGLSMRPIGTWHFYMQHRGSNSATNRHEAGKTLQDTLAGAKMNSAVKTMSHLGLPALLLQVEAAAALGATHDVLLRPASCLRPQMPVDTHAKHIHETCAC